MPNRVYFYLGAEEMDSDGEDDWYNLIHAIFRDGEREMDSDEMDSDGEDAKTRSFCFPMDGKTVLAEGGAQPVREDDRVISVLRIHSSFLLS